MATWRWSESCAAARQLQAGISKSARARPCLSTYSSEVRTTRGTRTPANNLNYTPTYNLLCNARAGIDRAARAGLSGMCLPYRRQVVTPRRSRDWVKQRDSQRGTRAGPTCGGGGTHGIPRLWPYTGRALVRVALLRKHGRIRRHGYTVTPLEAHARAVRDRAGPVGGPRRPFLCARARRAGARRARCERQLSRWHSRPTNPACPSRPRVGSKAAAPLPLRCGGLASGKEHLVLYPSVVIAAAWG